MIIPTQSRIFWCDTLASIPSADWERDTDFDNRFMQGSTVAGTNDGKTDAGHTHTQSHTHYGVTHYHTFSAASTTPAYADTRLLHPRQQYAVSPLTHSHAVENSGYSQITYQNYTGGPEFDSELPPYMRAIVLKPKATGKRIPNGSICFSDQSTVPNGFFVTDGNNGTVNLSDKYLLGAVTGGNGGGTGGAATHGHVFDDHTHTANSHYHESVVCGNSSSLLIDQTQSDYTYPVSHHNVELASKSLSDVSTDSAAISDVSTDPAYKKLLGIQNKLGSEVPVPYGCIIPFVGLSGDIPSDWVLCDGNNDTLDLTAAQVKITISSGEIGDTGGSNTHTHTVSSHTHTHTGSHNHTVTEVVNTILRGMIDDGASVPLVGYSHSHTWTVSSVTPSISAYSATTGSADGRYRYRTVLFIKYRMLPSLWVKGGLIKGGLLAGV